MARVRESAKSSANRSQAKLYVVMRMTHWGSLDVIGIPCEGVGSPDGSLGYMPVYDDYDKALANCRHGDTILPVVTGVP